MFLYDSVEAYLVFVATSQITRANDMLGGGCSFVCSVLAPCCAPEQWCGFMDSGWLWTKTDKGNGAHFFFLMKR